MCKKTYFKKFGLVAVLRIISGFVFYPVFAEDITLTTYCPAPFGVYNEMRAKKRP